MSEPECPATFLDQLRPVVDFMRQQYWLVYDPAERDRMLNSIPAIDGRVTGVSVDDRIR
jgi:hypothetical protein